jgi:hypothetical protein
MDSVVCCCSAGDHHLPHLPTIFLTLPPSSHSTSLMSSSTSPSSIPYSYPFSLAAKALRLPHRRTISTPLTLIDQDHALESDQAHPDPCNNYPHILSKTRPAHPSKLSTASIGNTSNLNRQSTALPHSLAMSSDVPASFFVNRTGDGSSTRSSSSVRRASVGSIGEDATGPISLLHDSAAVVLLLRGADQSLDIPQSFLDRGQKQLPSLDSDRSPSRNDAIHAYLHPNFYCPAGAFRGWNQPKMGLTKQSKSLSDLRGLVDMRSEWVWDSKTDTSIPIHHPSLAARRKVGIEDMPFEILGMRHLLSPLNLRCRSLLTDILQT